MRISSGIDAKFETDLTIPATIYTMDQTDREILDYLKRDGRASFTDIADEIGVSEGTVRNRVSSMQEEGVIEKFTVRIQREGVSAVVMLEVSTEVDIDQILESLPPDLEVHEVTGDFDLIIRMSRGSSGELNDTLDSIREVQGIEKTTTYSILQSHYR